MGARRLRGIGCPRDHPPGVRGAGDEGVEWPGSPARISNNNAKDILAAIKATLEANPTLVASGCLKQIKLGRDADHSGGFPYCRIYLTGFDNPVEDTISYARVYRYAVEIWQEITAKSKSDAETDFENALHLVLNRLSGTWQLGIGVEMSVIESSQVRTVVAENSGPLLVGTINLAVTTLIQNPS